MSDNPVSPLAPASFPEMPTVAGVGLSTGACGVKYKDRTDVLLCELAEGTTVAGVFTKSKTASSPVEWCRKALVGGEARAVLVNSGNANAFAGRKGDVAVEKTVAAVADVLSCRPSKVFAASTGVIGEALPYEKMTGAIADIHQAIDGDAGPAEWQAAAEAIMTTDTFAKGSTRTAKIGETVVTINGIAKGSGMIAPDMATMLSFVFTDATIPSPNLQEMLASTTERSFNAITVDSDTSTSDTLMLFATGAGEGHPIITDTNDPVLDDFKAMLDEVVTDLAHQVVRDGEGATKFISITVTGAEHDAAAKTVGLSIANSPLVKTAIAGEDANWGRIVMAIGKAGEKADRDLISIEMGGVTIAHEGLAVEGYDETPVVEHMKGEEIDIRVDLGIGSGKATVWTCDLTHGYITINADYRS